MSRKKVITVKASDVFARMPISARVHCKELQFLNSNLQVLKKHNAMAHSFALHLILLFGHNLVLYNQDFLPNLKPDSYLTCIS